MHLCSPRSERKLISNQAMTRPTTDPESWAKLAAHLPGNRTQRRLVQPGFAHMLGAISRVEKARAAQREDDSVFKLDHQ